MRKLIAIAVAFALIAAPSVASAGKKKKAKPYKSDTVSIAIGHPIANSATEGSIVGVTGQEFLAQCAVPASNGFDGYVFEVPAAYQKIDSSIAAVGSTPGDAYDVDIYTFDAECQPLQAINAAGTDESGAMVKGTAFVFVHNYLPPPVDVFIELKPL